MYGESKNAFLYSVQNPHLPVRDGRLPCLMQSSIGPRTEICGNLGLPFAKVPCLHQSIPLVGAKTALTTTGRQTTPSHVRQYRTENGNLRKSGSTFLHGTVFAPKQSLHQQEPKNMESPKMHSSSRFKNRNNYARRQTTPPHVSQYKAKNGNLWKSGSTFRHYTMFAPKQFLHQKEATGLESQKMHYSSRCKNRT